MADLIKVTDTGVIIGAVSELSKLSVNGGIYLFSPVDDFVGLAMRPNDGNKSSQIRALGDSNIPHSIIVFKQISPTGSGDPTDSRIDFQTMDGGVRATRLTIDENGRIAVGIANASYPLHVYNAANAKICVEGGAGGTYPGLILRHNGADKFVLYFEPTAGYFSIGRPGVADDLVIKSGSVGIGNTNPTSALDITGGVKVRGSSTNLNWEYPGQIAIKNNGPNDGFGISFHKADGQKTGDIQSFDTLFGISAGEDNDAATFTLDLNGITRLRIDATGKTAIGGYDSNLARPILGQFHVIGDNDRTGFLFAESPSLIGSTPVVLIDQDGANNGVNFGASGMVQIRSSDSVFYKGAFINVPAGTTQDVNLDANNSVTFDASNYQLKVYRALGNKAYRVSFMGMYK